MIPEMLAEIRFHYHGNMCSLNNILYQLGIRDGEVADKIGEKHFFKGLEAFQMMSEHQRRKYQR